MREQPTERVAVIAAAGRGSRFRHELPKVLADVGGRPCLQRVIDALEAGLGEHRQIIVVGEQADEIRAAIGDAPHREYVVQWPPRGTGDALVCAMQSLAAEASGHLYFFCGDKPLLSAGTVKAFRNRFETGPMSMLFLTGCIDGDDHAVRRNRQGRVVWVEHDGDTHALGIVERSAIDAIRGSEAFRLYNGAEHRFSKERLLGIREVNVSTYAWSLGALRKHLHELSDNNPQGEYLVTDLVQILLRQGYLVQTMALADPNEGKGIDTVEQWQELCAR